MTEPKGQGQEPTMEEILASIRRIISENDDPNAPASASAKPAAAESRPQPADDSVLELTEMVGADGKVVNVAAAKASSSVSIPEPPAKEEFSTMADSFPEPAPKPQAGDMPADDVELSAPEPAATSGTGSDDALVGAGTAAASAAAFAVLSQQLGRKDEGAPVTGAFPIGSGRTLEDLVQEMLRPMLRDWLDANLPGMVERMVKREIERIVRRAQD